VSGHSPALCPRWAADVPEFLPHRRQTGGGTGVAQSSTHGVSESDPRGPPIRASVAGDALPAALPPLRDPPDDTTEAEHRHALRNELSAAFGSYTSEDARRWLHQVCPHAAQRAGSPLPMIALLDVDEVVRARRRLGGLK
jgi:hypothetical protein